MDRLTGRLRVPIRGFLTSHQPAQRARGASFSLGAAGWGSGGVGEGWGFGKQVADVAAGAFLPGDGRFEVLREVAGHHPSKDALDSDHVEPFVRQVDLELVVPVLGLVSAAVVDREVRVC